MKIIELETKTGLDRATIRYYEKSGLISPDRQENGYRDYSEEDCDQLLKIKLLRQLGMSLERIRNLQQGSEDFSAVLNDQLQQLDDKIDASQQAKRVCQAMLNDAVTYDTLNTQLYFEKLAEGPNTNVPATSTTYHDTVALEPYHPVRRYLARCLDYFLITFIVLFILIVVLRVRPLSDFPQKLISYGVPFLAVPISAFFLRCFGTTPGKYLMGLAVHSSDSDKMSFSDALHREWQVLRFGYGFGIPIWTIYRLYKTYRQHRDLVPMNWDYRSEYIYHYWDRKRITAMVLAVVVLISGYSLTILDIIKPHYRGDLTISEFSSNFNDYADMLYDDDWSPAYLQSDGTWKKHTNDSNSNTVVITLGSISEGNDFSYELEGERITAIRYQNTWTQITACMPLNSIQLVAVTALMSQKGTGLPEYNELLELMEANLGQQKAEFTCENIEVRWNIETVNCIQSANNTYWEKDSELESSLTLDFELIIH